MSVGLSKLEEISFKKKTTRLRMLKKNFIQNLKKQVVHDDDIEDEDDSTRGTPSGGKRKRTTVNVVVPPDCVLDRIKSSS